MNTRNQIVDLLPIDSIGCELGVFEGNFSEILTASKKFKKLYLVDIFSGIASNFGKTYTDASVLEQYVKNKFTEYSIVEIIKQDSLTFLQSLPNNSLNFIYIDTVHSYEQTMNELNESYRVIQNGGYICGHDYCEIFQGVIDSVTDFTKKYNLDIIITQENDFPSFIIQVINKNE
jgi:hypothetical protein